ncbi:MAG: SWIM zinc finger family protein [Clostridia bacterium]|nr:SWIM zinc finger family protein [Clostridia bacterium]
MIIILGLFFIVAIVLPLAFIYHLIKHSLHSKQTSSRKPSDYITIETKRRIYYPEEYDGIHEPSEDVKIRAEQRAMRIDEQKKDWMQLISIAVDHIFMLEPWSKWDSSINTLSEQKYQMSRARYKLKILSFVPADTSARILDDGLYVYAVSALCCECHYYRSNSLPCRHMYFLAYHLFYGFDADTIIEESHSIKSAAETKAHKIAEQKRIKNERASINRRVFYNIKKFCPVSRRDIFDHFPELNPKDLQKVADSLCFSGSVVREKRSNRYYYFVDNKSEGNTDLDLKTKIPPGVGAPRRDRGIDK